MRYGRTLSLLRQQLHRVAHASSPLSAAAGAAVAARRGALGGSGAGAAGGALVHVRGWAAAASTTEEMPETVFHQAADHILEALQDKVEVTLPPTRGLRGCGLQSRATTVAGDSTNGVHYKTVVWGVLTSEPTAFGHCAASYDGSAWGGGAGVCGGPEPTRLGCGVFGA
jgi:hypothetical protein